MRGLSLVAASGGHSSSRCTGLSLSQTLLLWSTGSRRAGSVVVAHGPSCSVACGIFPDQGSNPCPLHWQADSQPLCHQGSLTSFFKAVLGSQQNWEEVREVSNVPQPPHMQSLLCYQHHFPERYICCNWWTYIDTSWSPKVYSLT